MPSTIKCPNCQHEFAMEEAMQEQYKKDLQKDLREQMLNFNRKKEEEFQKKTAEYDRQLKDQKELMSRQMEEEKRKLQEALELNLRQSISADFENRVTLLQQSNQEQTEKLRLARSRELELLQKEQELKTKGEELELSVQRKMQAEREKIATELRRVEEQRSADKETEHQMRVRELEKQVADQKKLAEEMQRKMEQGSMQLQGEVQELALEKLLQEAFPFDVVAPVAKGVKGADCTLTVRNPLGVECGTIIFESKRTKNFEADWIDKLKSDMRQQSAHLAVLVTKVMPKDMDCFGDRNGIWICSFSEVKALTQVLRDGIIRVFQAARNNQNKGDKMQLLYDYLTGTEFSEQWKAIREGLFSMKISIQRERDNMEKMWKAREKQLEKVLLNAVHIRGSIEGIAGQDTIEMGMLEDDNEILGIE